MSKAILLSIKPKYVADILNGIKTIEIRKTAPKDWVWFYDDKHPVIEPEPIDVYIYCTKGKEICLKENDSYKLWSKEKIAIVAQGGNINCSDFLNGKVVAKFTLKKVEEIQGYCDEQYQKYVFNNQDELLNKSCLSDEELGCYLKFYNNNGYEKVGYAWHISNLVIFDRPKKLRDFTNCDEYPYTRYISKAPQSWRWVEVE